jgi:hypothetical protein
MRTFAPLRNGLCDLSRTAAAPPSVPNNTQSENYPFSA